VKDPLAWIDEELRGLDSAGLRRVRQARAAAQGATIRLNGRELVNFGSNDYLGLANDKRLTDAAAGALEAAGCGAGASPLVSGYADAHRKLEERLARFEGTEAALVFISGYAANLGTIPALVGAGNLVLSDEKNHASIIDGCRLSRAEVRIFRHRDAAHAAEVLSQANHSRRTLIVTDSVFSMDGDLAPLVELAQLAEKSAAMLLVDEAHATGVFGTAGRGLCEALGVEERVHVRVGTLSKALGCAGAAVVDRLARQPVAPLRLFDSNAARHRRGGPGGRRHRD
jgi:8-amino-7-oxononanoate synthase